MIFCNFSLCMFNSETFDQNKNKPNLQKIIKTLLYIDGNASKPRIMTFHKNKIFT